MGRYGACHENTCVLTWAACPAHSLQLPPPASAPSSPVAFHLPSVRSLQVSKASPAQNTCVWGEGGAFAGCLGTEGGAFGTERPEAQSRPSSHQTPPRPGHSHRNPHASRQAFRSPLGGLLVKCLNQYSENLRPLDTDRCNRSMGPTFECVQNWLDWTLVNRERLCSTGVIWSRQVPASNAPFACWQERLGKRGGEAGVCPGWAASRGATISAIQHRTHIAGTFYGSPRLWMPTFKLPSSARERVKNASGPREAQR